MKIPSAVDLLISGGYKGVPIPLDIFLFSTFVPVKVH